MAYSKHVEPPDLSDEYPKTYIPASEVYEHFDDGDAETVLALREAGAAVIRAEYYGGWDESRYDLLDVFDSEGQSIRKRDAIQEIQSCADYAHQPEIVAVEAAIGQFSGAGDGSTFGGAVEMRLDTFETRKYDEFYEEMSHTVTEDASWTENHHPVF